MPALPDRTFAGARRGRSHQARTDRAAHARRKRLGKTTTCAKLASRLKGRRQLRPARGANVRAAAIEQLETWGSARGRCDSSDGRVRSAAVVFDAGKARRRATSTRDHRYCRACTRSSNLMDDSPSSSAWSSGSCRARPRITMVLDAPTGQKGFAQASVSRGIGRPACVSRSWTGRQGRNRGRIPRAEAPHQARRAR